MAQHGTLHVLGGISKRSSTIVAIRVKLDLITITLFNYSE
jgi:hypothetical protein